MLRLTPETKERARRSLLRRDRALAPVVRSAGPCELVPRGDPYGALMRSIIFQQLQGKAAAAIAGRVGALYGGRYPKPEALKATRDPALRKAGLSHQKIRALRSLAEACAEGRIRPRRLFHMEDAAVVEAVTQVHGIGEWTAHMPLMSSLGRTDVLPTGDYGIRKGAMLVYGLDAMSKPAELEALGERWRPYRSVGSWYLWRATEMPELFAAPAAPVAAPAPTKKR
jgi:DNA-3-methyladenine glycosylase II